MAKSKNFEALVNNLTRKFNNANVDLDNNVTNNDNTNTNADAGSDHNYYLDLNTEPPRFAQYRLARRRMKQDNITQDELEYDLKGRLRVSPEERYRHIKKEWYFHETSYLHQTVQDGKYVDIVKDYGCGHWSLKGKGNWCVPECRYYAREGRIEDDQVVAEFHKYADSYRQRNAIVEPSTLLTLLTQKEREQPYFQEYYDESDMP